MSLIQIFKKGEDHISPNSRRMWELVYNILLTYGCPVIYRVRDMNARLKIDFYHEFFVPRNHPNKDDIVQYIIKELKMNLREGETAIDGSYLWGEKLNIYEFDGIDPYVDSETVSQMAEKYVEYLRNKLIEMKEKGNKTVH